MKKDVVVIGAGAAGLMCAITAAQRGRDVLIIDHANKAGKKILMSGGGRCNFTNYYVEPDRFISDNPHFCKSALARYTQWDFIAMVEAAEVAYHEKTLGQLFCDHKAKDILNMLLDSCEQNGVDIRLKTSVTQIKKAADGGFELQTSAGKVQCESLVIATGALSIPTMGATGFGYEVAKQFGLNVKPTCAGLVPFTMHKPFLDEFAEFSGTSVDVQVSCNGQHFRENMLFTHRGLSGPAMLQISSYWKPGQFIEVDLMPGEDALHWLQQQQVDKPDSQLNTVLTTHFSKKLAAKFCEIWFQPKPMKQFTSLEIQQIAKQLSQWQIKPNATEGYRTAEVTLGGVDTDQISSKTMQAKTVEGLYFIGEVLDVTGHLGGFNFQWAWASGFVCGEVA
jgi:predicted Rossmann fold flavoprotein